MKSILIAILLSAVVLTNCAHSPAEITTEERSDGTTLFTGNAMTMHYRILVGKHVNADLTLKIKDSILNTFREVNEVFNKWNPSSELSQLNDLKKGEKKVISKQLQELLEITNKVVKVTEGRFDPTIEPIQKLWNTKLDEGTIPTEKEIAAIAPAIGWDKVHFNDGVFYKDNDDTKIDLGGIAKGHAIDMLVERIAELGLSDLYVEWGGEIRAQGTHPEGRPWKVFIARLTDEDPNHALATVELKNQGLATSGDYLQNTTVRGITYFHIIDPRTLTPLMLTPTSIASATVLGPTCAYADGLATAAMIFPDKEAAAHWFEGLKDANPDLTLWVFTRAPITP